MNFITEEISRKNMFRLVALRDQACDAYIKRVVALPGEIVSVNSKGEVIINNKLISEPYVSYKCAPSFFYKCGEFENIKVPKDHFLVLGA